MADEKPAEEKPEGGKWTNPGEYFVTVEGRQVALSDPSFGGRERMKVVEALSTMHGDVIAASYPKSGTHWINEIVYLLISDLDVDGMKESPITRRATLTDCYHPDALLLEDISKSPHPWCLHTHLYPEHFKRALYEKKAKFVVIMRNPKDTLVSYFNFSKAIPHFRYPRNWNAFFEEEVKTNRTLYGNPIDHVLSWWRLRNLDNVHIVRYEDMKKDPLKQITQVAKFLRKDFSDEMLQTIVEHTTFKNMKEHMKEEPNIVGKEGKGSVLRKGEAGDWKNYFSDEQAKYVDDLCKEKLAIEGLVF